MFRKPFSVKSQHSCKTSEVKWLRTNCSNWFALASQTDVLEAIPAKADVQVAKIALNADGEGGSTGSCVVYRVGGQPMFWHLKERGRLNPTVYALWKIPYLSPVILTHAAVMDRLADGADLMLPGVIMPQEGFAHDFKKGEIVAIALKEHPYSTCALAVGEMLVSKDEMLSSGMRGKGVKILHTFQDFLWEFGDKSLPPLEHPRQKGNKEEVEETESAPDIEITNASSSDLSGDVDGKEEPVGPTAEPGKEKDTQKEAAESISPAEMDKLFQSALYTAVVKHLATANPKDIFPLSSSNLYSKYILPCREHGTTLDIRHTTHKKLGKFLKVYDKKGVLKTKETKGDTVVLGVNKQHPEVVNFTPPRKLAGVATASSSEVTPVDNSCSTSAAQSKENSSDLIKITELYKPSGSAVVQLFKDMGISKDELLTAQEIRAAVGAYAEKMGLVDQSNPRLVRMTPLLVEALFKKGDGGSVEAMPRDHIVENLAEKMQGHHKTDIPAMNGKPATSVIRKGAAKPIQILVERRNAKLVSRVTGLELFEIDVEAFASEMKIACAASTSVVPHVGAPKVDRGSAMVEPLEVVIQGSKVVEVSKALKDKYRVPFKSGQKLISKWVVVMDMS